MLTLDGMRGFSIDDPFRPQIFEDYNVCMIDDYDIGEGSYFWKPVCVWSAAVNLFTDDNEREHAGWQSCELRHGCRLACSISLSSFLPR